jgi:hypothetical protein
MDTCRLRIKIGPYEMEAEGPRDFVETHYGSFSERIPKTTQLVPVNPPGHRTEVPGADDGARFTPLFHLEPNGTKLSLTVKPAGESAELDGLLLVLLGHKETRGIDTVSADELLFGLKQSGYPIDRTDRIAAKAEADGFLTKTGVRRGTRYRLTVPGLSRAKATAEGLIENLA